jgi:hypothetical protein
MRHPAESQAGHDDAENRIDDADENDVRADRREIRQASGEGVSDILDADLSYDDRRIRRLGLPPVIGGCGGADQPTECTESLRLSQVQVPGFLIAILFLHRREFAPPWPLPLRWSDQKCAGTILRSMKVLPPIR